MCVPARLVGTPLWANKRGNHTWVEVWDKGWHFTGACEPDPNGLDRGWFVGDAAQAKKDSFEHAIYAASFKKTEVALPPGLGDASQDVPAANVTDRYAKQDAAKAETVRVAVRVIDEAKKRVAMPVTVTASGDAKAKLEGTSRGDAADANDFLSFELKSGQDYVVKVAGVEKTIKASEAGKQQVIDIVLPSK